MTLGAFLALVFILLAVVFVVWLTSKARLVPESRLQRGETSFLNGRGELTAFPEPYTPEALVKLSVIVPARDEEKRIHLVLGPCLEYLHERERKDPKYTFEVIVVLDGCTDNTYKVVLGWLTEHPHHIRILQLQKNRGKGGAVRKGVMVARGSLIMYADADGATNFSDIEKVEKELYSIVNQQGYGISCGSRAHLQRDAEIKRSFSRNLLMWGFHVVVKYIGGVKDIRDTQCGFKMFTRTAAHQTFRNLHIERWVFDVELLWLAQQFKIPITEVQVNWREIEGSHLEEEGTKIVSIKMFMDLLQMKLLYLLGMWQVSTNNTKKKM